jgi:transposase
MPRRAYPSDVTDEEWLFVSPYLTLMRKTPRSAKTTYARASTACAG